MGAGERDKVEEREELRYADRWIEGYCRLPLEGGYHVNVRSALKQREQGVDKMWSGAVGIDREHVAKKVENEFQRGILIRTSVSKTS